MKKKKSPHQSDELVNSSCSVLITCGKPSKDGKMNVEMTCQGDITLAGYLLNQAAQILSEQEAELEEEHFSPKTISLFK